MSQSVKMSQTDLKMSQTDLKMSPTDQNEPNWSKWA